MTRTWNFGCGLLVAIASTEMAGCGQRSQDIVEISSKLVSGSQDLFIPGYYPQEDTTSRNALTRGQLNGLIVANFSPGGPGTPGPGTDHDQVNDDWITALDQWWTDDLVMGYVDNPYDPTGANLLFQQEQIRHWSQWYHVDGIMFDDSQRDLALSSPTHLTDAEVTADIARMQHLLLYAIKNAHYPGINTAEIAFNWGMVDARMERYVWCALQTAGSGQPDVFFGTGETTELEYQSSAEASNWASADATWVREYSPHTFYHLIYSADPNGSGIATDLSLSRNRNAGRVLITDGGMTIMVNGQPQTTHHWAQLPGRADPSAPTDLFSRQFTAVGHTTAEFPDRTSHTQSDSCPPHELQIGGIATQSSDIGGPPERAIDSNESGNWYDNSVTHTNFEFQPWWQVDLGATSFVSSVDVYNRTDCCGDRLTNFNVMTSQDGATWTTVNFPGQAGTPTNVAINASARYVRVQLVGSNYLSLAEVKVWTP